MDTDTKTIISIIDNKENLRSRELLSSFVRYCLENKELRFWQAITNWCKWNFVFLATSKPIVYDEKVIWRIQEVRDPYGWEENHDPFERNTGSKPNN